MARAHSKREPNFTQTFKQAVLSSFVILTFAAYTLHEHLSGATDAPVVAAQPTVVAAAPQPARTVPDSSSGSSRSDPAQAAPQRSSPSPTPRPAPSATATRIPGSQFRDGDFVGTASDAFWGDVQVKATIRGGKVSDVQFMLYPSDRRTSQRINEFAMPILKTEALQKQSASVDIISGATLTSEAFMRSLQSALSKAKA